MRKFVPFNLNRSVKVKIKPGGLKILKEAHDQQNIYYGRKDAFTPPEIDEEGYAKYQAWDFMKKFGAHFYCDFDVPIEPIILLEQND